MWSIEFVDYPLRLDGETQWAICDPPDVPGKRLRIHRSLRNASEQEALDVINHEVLHMGLWDLDEEPVREIARDQARCYLKIREALRGA